MDSRATRENDDSSFSVILEGAVRLSSGIHCLRLSPFVASPLDSRATRENDDSSFSVILEGARRAQLGDPLFTAFAICGFATGFPRYARE